MNDKETIAQCQVCGREFLRVKQINGEIEWMDVTHFDTKFWSFAPYHHCLQHLMEMADAD